ncbi:hypothetical protein [Paraburkholderia kirstenboschensis]|uniref:hypothetical protein n=1 Tax=Paraburkholderia kirstenboschensis TaxID=1245436 RepID=UPI000A6FAE11|nr:hypothetical protein [Paraburkholderia kirstenboschensis]
MNDVVRTANGSSLFWVLAPCGLCYGPPMTYEQALQCIKGHSLYPDEPNWTIAREADLQAAIQAIDARMEAESRARLAQFESEFCGRDL